MAKLTLCMIVRDEEAMLPDCLASVRNVVDRMIVVDTGSSDGTRKVIRRFGAELVEHPWNDDFAAARNAGLALVDSGYVLVLDADERLTKAGARAVRETARRGEIDLGLLSLHHAASLFASPIEVLSGRERHGEPMALPRLMRWTPDLRFEGVVHESVSAWASAPGRRIEPVDAPIVHYGAAPNQREAREKGKRNLRLLERRCELEPDNPMPHAYLAAELQRADRLSEALEAARESWATWRRARARGERHDCVLPVSVLAPLALQAGDVDEAYEVSMEALEFEEHPNLHLLAGLALESRVLRQGGGTEKLEQAAQRYERALALAGRTFVSEVMAGATSWQAAVRLGTVRLLAGDPEAACTAFEQALSAREELAEATLGLAEAKLALGEPREVLTLVEGLAASGSPDAWLLSARAALDLGALDVARSLCERARSERDRTSFAAPHRDRAITVLERELSQLESSPAAESGEEVQTCVFAWPCYGEPEDLDALMGEYGKLLADRPDLVLCLRFDGAVDGDYAQAEAGIGRAFSAHLGEDRALQVVLVDQDLDAETGAAVLAAPGDIALALPHTGGVRERFLEELGARRVDSPEALSAALGGAG